MRTARLFCASLTVLVLCFADARAEGLWSRQILESYPEFALTASGVQLGPHGVPHVFVGGDRVYQYWLEGGVWRSEVIDATPRSGQDLQAAVGPGGEFHLFYVRHDLGPESDPQLQFVSSFWMHASNPGGTWRIEALERVPGAVFAPDEHMSGLAIDARGEPHFLVYGPEEGLSHLWSEGGVWRRERIDTDPVIGVGQSTTEFGAPSQLAIDAQGRVHAIWFTFGVSDLVYSLRDSSGWRHERITAVGGAEFDPGADPSALLVDSAGNAHIVLNAQPGLVHLTNAGGSWRLDPLTYGAFRQASVLDADGNLHVLALTSNGLGTGVVLRYVLLGPAGFSVQTVPSDAQSTSQLSLRADAGGAVHGAILTDRLDQKGRDLDYLHGPGAWIALELARSAPVVLDQAMSAQDNRATVGADVRISVVGTQRRLMYRTGGLLGGFVDVRYALEGDGGFAIESLPSPGALYVDPRSLAFGTAPDGSEHVVWTDGRLLHAVREGGTWTIQPESNAGSNARRPALAFDAAGVPQVLFTQSATSLGHSARLPLGGGGPEQIAPLTDELLHLTLEGVALAPAPLGAIHAAWVDQDRIYHGTNASGQWTREVVAALPDQVYMGSHALAVESDGTVHVAFERKEPGLYVRHDTGLVYGTNRCPGGFAFSDVDPEFGPGLYFRTRGGRHPDLILDRNGNPHISYRQDAHLALRYARVHDGRWTLETIAEDTYQGEHSAIALGDDGTVSVGFFDHWAGEVGLATRTEPVELEPRWDGCPPLPDPNQTLEGSFVFRSPPGSLPLYDGGGDVDESYDTVRAQFLVEQWDNGNLRAAGGADADGDSAIDAVVRGSGKVSAKRGAIQVKRKIAIKNLDSVTPLRVKLKVARVETITPTTRARTVTETVAGKIGGRKVKATRTFSDTVPSEAFGMHVLLQLSNGPKGLTASGSWPTRDGHTVNLTGTGTWSAAKHSADLRLRAGKIDIRLSGLRAWRTGGDEGVQLRADSISVTAFGQKLAGVDLSGDY